MAVGRTCLWIACLSYVGALCRYGVSLMSTEAGVSVRDGGSDALEAVLFPDIVANGLGSFVMGLLVAWKDRIQPKMPDMYKVRGAYWSL